MGSLRLDGRAAVAIREVSVHGQTLIYLSLFDDEIEARLDAFLSASPAAAWNATSLVAAACHLEPTDAAIVSGGRGEVLVARGGACNFPLYWSSDGARLVVSTKLPVDRERRLSLSGLHACIAVVSVTYQNEPNLSLLTPLPAWRRIRRGAVSTLSPMAGCLAERAVDLAEADIADLERDDLISAIRAALDTFGRRQRSRRAAVVELSGGFDSTLAAAAAHRHGVDVLGVSLHFPFYEFRFEEDLQRSVARTLGIRRICLDGPELYAYAPPDRWLRLDEPATAVIGLKRDLTIARIAGEAGTDRVLVGQGGDQIFSEDLLEPVPGSASLAREAFSARGWQMVERALDDMSRATGFLNRSVLTYLHDARLDAPMKESVGTQTRSPFSDIDMVRCAFAWAKLSARRNVREGKRILAEAFADALPDEVTDRRSKVSWDGVCARGYARHSEAIAAEIERASALLAHIGLDPRWLTRRVGQLARWEMTTFGQDDKEVFAAYALATWLRSWGIETVADCDWTD